MSLRRRCLRTTAALAALVGVALAAAMFAAPAGATAKAAPQNVSPPTISGTPRDDRTLTANNGTWNNNPTTFFYQWQRCNADGTSCTNITGATKKTYTLTSADIDHRMRVIVTASNADGQTAATSQPTDVVSSNNPPRNTAPPTIAGTPQVGEELTASPGTWTGGVRSYAYQWRRCDTAGAGCADISGATGRAYGVRAADVGRTLRVVVTATNAAGSTTATSNATAAVRSATSPPAPPPAPGVNKRPTIAIVSARFRGLRLFARIRVCDDSRRKLAIIERDSKPGRLSYTRRFSTVTAPRPCGVYSRSWVPAPRFRTRGRFIVTVWARDYAGLMSRPARRTFFR
jgi:hypothetical protein